MSDSANGRTSSQSINYNTPFAQQTFIASIVMVIFLLANVGAAATANERYDMHVRDVQVNVMEVESEYSELSNMFDKEKREHVDRLHYLKDLRDALKTTLASVKQTDVAHPLTILNLNATWSMYTGILSAMTSIFVTLLSSYTRESTSQSNT